MANMRVHELAKELNISSKDITDMLSNNEKKYTAMSGLGEAEINSVKGKFKAKPVASNNAVKSEPKKAEERNVKIQENNKVEEKKVNTEKKEQIKSEDVKASAEKKTSAQDGDKKHISQVYFPQNSQKSDNRERNNNRRDGNNGNYRNNDRNRDNRDNRDGNNGGYRNNDRNRDGNGAGYSSTLLKIFKSVKQSHKAYALLHCI